MKKIIAILFVSMVFMNILPSVNADIPVKLGTSYITGMHYPGGRKVISLNNTTMVAIWIDTTGDIHCSLTENNGVTWTDEDELDRAGIIRYVGMVNTSKTKFHVTYSYNSLTAGYVPITLDSGDLSFGSYVEKDEGHTVYQTDIIYNHGDSALYWFVIAKSSDIIRLYYYKSVDNGISWGSNPPFYNNGNEKYIKNMSGTPSNLEAIADSSGVMYIFFKDNEYNDLIFIGSSDYGSNWGSNGPDLDNGKFENIVDGAVNTDPYFPCALNISSQLHLIYCNQYDAGRWDLRWIWSNDSFTLANLNYDNTTLMSGQDYIQHHPTLAYDKTGFMYLFYRQQITTNKYIYNRTFNITGFSWMEANSFLSYSRGEPHIPELINRYNGSGDFLVLNFSDASGVWWQTFDLENKIPWGSIDSPASDSNHNQGQNIGFNCTGHDKDIITYTWTSNINGLLSNKQNFTTKSLSVGKHTITCSMSDSIGDKNLYVVVTISGSVSVGAGGGAVGCCCIGGVIVGLLAVILLLKKKR